MPDLDDYIILKGRRYRYFNIRKAFNKWVKTINGCNHLFMRYKLTQHPTQINRCYVQIHVFVILPDASSTYDPIYQGHFLSSVSIQQTEIDQFFGGKIHHWIQLAEERRMDVIRILAQNLPN